MSPRQMLAFAFSGYQTRAEDSRGAHGPMANHLSEYLK